MSTPSIFLFQGEDEYRLSRELQEFIDKQVPISERDGGLEIINGSVTTIDDAAAAIRETLLAVKTPSLFGSDKTVWLRDITFLGGSRMEKSKAMSEHVAAFAAALKEGIPEGFTLVLSGCDITAANPVTKAVAELAKGKVGEVRNFALAKKGRALERQALDFILSESERLGQKLTTQTATAMVAQVGCDMRLLSSEVDKLLLYCGGRAPNEQDVAAVCAASRETEAWDLQDVFGARNLPASLKVLHRLVDQGVSPFFLIIQLQGRVNEMLIIKDSLARKWARGDHGFEWSGDLPEEADAAGADLNARWNPAGKHPFVLSKLVAQTKNFTRYDLRRARSVLMDTRERMVSSGVQPEVILEIGLADALQPMQAAR